MVLTSLKQIPSFEDALFLSGANQKQVDIFVEYARKIIFNEAPVILEFRHLALLLGLDSSQLAKISVDNKSSYRQFNLPKRSGGHRVIAVPYPRLAKAQSWVMKNILANISVNDHAHGYVRNRSILTNANVHFGAKELLKIDIEDFFGNININRVIQVFKNIGYTNKVSYHLAELCCYEKKLPQGACTSPIISNIVARFLDNRLSSLSESLNLSYTRYVDDITFSGDKIPPGYLSYVENIISEAGFSINRKKTIFKGEKQRKIVTGLLVSGSKVRVLKKYRRDFRKKAHVFLKLIYCGRITDAFNNDPLYLDRLIGRGNYIFMVEPDNDHVKKVLFQLNDIKNKYI